MNIEQGTGDGAVERGRVQDLSLSAGRPCLDFADTLEWRGRARPTEYLHTYADLVAWGAWAGLLSGEQAAALLAEAARRPDDAADALRRAKELREAIFRVFEGVVEGVAAPSEDLEALNAAVAQAAGRLRVAPAAGGFAWEWSGGDRDLDRVLWPVARDAADLLTSGDVGRVRVCEGEACGWLFLDRSKNRSRRWCSMQECGNREKARRHYRRARDAGRRGEDG